MNRALRCEERGSEGLAAVRIVACQQCQTQLDVSDIRTKSVRCRCGEIVENRALDGLDLQVCRCSACGAGVAEGAERCDYCGSEIILNRRNLSLICPSCYARNADNDRFCSGCGGHFAPVQMDEDGAELLCVDCEMPLQPRMVGDVRISECPACNGIWVPDDRFDRLMAGALEARKKADSAALRSLDPRTRGANPASQRVQYRDCLVCKQQMRRRNFRKTSGVIIDCCNSHGTWLDADELERLAGFLLSGGRPMAEWYLQNESAKTENLAVPRPLTDMASLTFELGSSTRRSQRIREKQPEGLGLIAKIFSELLD
jgi:Zn-finger nucleic acid-binding protein